MRALAALALFQGLTGCAWLLGHDVVPQAPSPFRLEPATATAEAGGLRVQGAYLGLGERIVTHRNLFGRVGRVANPYGEDSLVFQLAIENRSQEPLVVLPHQATLAVDGGTPHPARTLADYRKRWPTWAVTHPDEGEDQGAAYQHVVDTLLIERVVRAGQSSEGRLAFPRAVAKSELVVRLPYQVGFRKQHLELKWSVR